MWLHSCDEADYAGRKENRSYLGLGAGAGRMGWAGVSTLALQSEENVLAWAVVRVQWQLCQMLRR